MNEKKEQKKNTYKRTYHLPVALMDVFKDWCNPGRDYSPKIAGAILYYMSLEPNVRDSCEKAAYKDSAAIKKAISQLAAQEKTFSPLAQDLLRFLQQRQQVAEQTPKTKKKAIRRKSS